jgi:hypothetical protein
LDNAVSLTLAEASIQFVETKNQLQLGGGIAAILISTAAIGEWSVTFVLEAAALIGLLKQSYSGT